MASSDELGPLLPQFGDSDDDNEFPDKDAAAPSRFVTMRLATFSTGAFLMMYGMRKPWAALSYEGISPLLGASPKVAIAVSQIVSSANRTVPSEDVPKLHTITLSPA